LICGIETSDDFNKWTELYESALNSTADPLEPSAITQRVSIMEDAFGTYCTNSTEEVNYLTHLNAPNIARDIDLIRNLTGWDTINFYGMGWIMDQ
jgi:hypothetical protein